MKAPIHYLMRAPVHQWTDIGPVDGLKAIAAMFQGAADALRIMEEGGSTVGTHRPTVPTVPRTHGENHSRNQDQ